MAQPAMDYGQLHVDGTKLKDQQNNVVVLRGMSYGWHNWWPRFYNSETVEWLKNDWGCTVVRAAMGVQAQEDEDLKKGYIKKPEWSVEKIKSVVDGAISFGIYVIIDWHSHTIQTKAAKKFFAEMAKTYGEYPNVIYEIFNEPVQHSWEEVKNYSVEIIKTIREIDPDNVIIVGTPHWDQDIHIAADDPITGFSNIMYSIHFYAATHNEELRKRGDYALEKGLPVFVSECAGMAASGDGPLDYEEWQRWIEWMEANQISWIIWSISDKNESCSVLKKTASSKGEWKEKNLKVSGKEVRKIIRNYAGLE